MSFLYPLLLAGVAAVAAPILLHMIRRHTRNRVTFSSLMFLRTTAPRFKHRSRLEHIALLVLRCIVLCLLAFAFARPFLSRAAAVNAARVGRRIVLLIDTSASMRRTGVWAKAIDEAKSVLADAGPADRLCLMSYDQAARTRIGFEQWQAMDPARRVPVAMQELSQLSPGWAATNLGQALVTAAEAIEDDDVSDEQQAAGVHQIVLVSDLQQGSNLDALLAYEWPQRTELAVKAIACRDSANASLQWMADRDAPAPGRRKDSPKIRVTNSSDSDKDHFQLRWESLSPFAPEGGSAASGHVTDVYVAPGHSVVVRAAADANQAQVMKVILTGDEQGFDNTLYLAPVPQRQINVLYIGSDEPDSATEMLYYIRRAFGTGGTSQVVRRPGTESISAGDIKAAHMIIVTESVSGQNLALLRQHLESGGVLLLVLKSTETVAALSGLTGIGDLQSSEADAGRYAMLDRIELDHPLLKAFADPRFGDFTRIHFWKHRRINPADCPGARVLARFDDGDSAWLEIPVGKGSLLVWTSGWHPADSDLALSSKFVPLLYSALEYGGALAGHQSQYFIGDSVSVAQSSPAGATDAAWRIRRPDASVVRLDAGRQTLTETDLPGIYTVTAPAGSRDAESRVSVFAVNLFAEESRTEPMPIEEIEKKGVLLKPASVYAAQPLPPGTSPGDGHAALGFHEMESQQKLWRWVLVATLAVLLIETWLGGWLTRPGPESKEEQT
jgi:hypothetical protein